MIATQPSSDRRRPVYAVLALGVGAGLLASILWSLPALAGLDEAAMIASWLAGIVVCVLPWRVLRALKVAGLTPSTLSAFVHAAIATGAAIVIVTLSIYSLYRWVRPDYLVREFEARRHLLDAGNGADLALLESRRAIMVDPLASALHSGLMLLFASLLVFAYLLLQRLQRKSS